MKHMNKAHMELLAKLLGFSDRYEIDIQFWPQQTAVFISKEGIELTSFGGDFNHTVKSSIDYLNRINKPSKQ